MIPVMEDNLFLLDIPSIKKILIKNEENLLFSCIVQKYNRKDVRQERVVMITDRGLYNLKKTSIKRRIDLNEIKGITTSITGTEFVLHVPSEYDYRYSSSLHREKIINILRRNCGCLAFFEKKDNQLKMYTTTRKDKKKNISRLPQEYAQAHENIKNMVQMRENILGCNQTKEELILNTQPLYCNLNQSSMDFFSQQISKNSSDPSNRRGSIITLDDFDIIKVLGRGTFGKVMMVQKKDSGVYYALKSIRKEKITHQKQAEHLFQERQILETINNTFLVKLKYTFQTNDKIFFIMDFIKGGELFQHLKIHRRFSENIAKFFAAEVLLALEYLHSRKIVYRDLKPENVLLDENGHICITDFGLAKSLETNQKYSSLSKLNSQPGSMISGDSDGMTNDTDPSPKNSCGSNSSASSPKLQPKDLSSVMRERTNSFVGTPSYLSPEIISRAAHSYQTDIWQLGLFIFELIFGYPPFYHQSTQIIFQLISECRVFFPQHIKVSDQCKSIVSQLLQKDPSKRLTLQQAKNHPWFSDINWEKLSKKQIASPYIPPTKDDQWIKGFDGDFTSEPPINSLGPENLLPNESKINFDDLQDFCHDDITCN